MSQARSRRAACLAMVPLFGVRTLNAVPGRPVRMPGWPCAGCAGPRRWRSGPGGQARQFGAGLVQVVFGALGAGPQVIAGLGQAGDLGVQRCAQLGAFTVGVGADLAELAGGFVAGLAGVGPGLVRAGLGCGGALERRPAPRLGPGRPGPGRRPGRPPRR